MSKTARSKSGSRSSRSRTPSRSRSRSFSKSRSRSRSLSHPRKRRHSSRSRSRSYSPSHNRERNYPRVYQNRDNFRGNNRGYRRPYFFRPRGGRGFYPRGQYNRGGYVNYNRPNWQNYNRPPYSPRRGRSRSRTPKRRSPSPRSRSHSRNSDKSSSDRSRRSSSSKSSSSNHSIVESSKRRSRKEKKARSKDKRASLQTTGEDDSKETSLSGGGEPNSKTETSKDWQDISYDTSPIAQHSPERGPTLKSSVQSVVVRRCSPRQNPLQKSPPSPQGVPQPSGSSFRAMSRQSPFDHNTSMSPPKKGPLSKTSPIISSLYGNQKEEGRIGDTGPYSKRYLEDQKTKASDLDRDTGKDKESKLGSLEKMKDRGSPSDFAMNELEKAYRSSQSPKRYKIRDDFEKIKMAEFHKENRYGKEDADEQDKKGPVRGRKDSDFDNETKSSSKAFAAASKNLDPYDPGKWEEIKFSSKDKHRKSEELDDDDDDLFPLEQSKKERAAAKRAEQAQKGSLADKNFRVTSFKTMQEKSTGSPPRKASEKEKMASRDNMAFAKSTFCISRETGSNVRIDSFDEDLARPSGMLAHERKLSRDLVHTNKKEADFRSIFQHIQSAQPQRSPSELFAQHIVTIVHHVKEHHFGPGGMTLNERFTKYLKKGADQEPTKSKKSPEIHRRIDISPTAFKKGFGHEETKGSKESSHKSEGKYKDEPVEIERRKKHKEHKRGRSRETPDSRDSSRSRERSVEKPPKSRKGSKKHKKHRKVRERSPSPSTTASSRSRSSHSLRGGEEGRAESEEKEEIAPVFDKPRAATKEFAGPSERGRGRGNFQYRARGRGWGRGTFAGNSSNDFKNRSKDEDWDPEFAPKSKKYYPEQKASKTGFVGEKNKNKSGGDDGKKNPEHDDREGENEEKWVSRGRGRGAFPRGRGRFLFRKPGNSPKWSHDKFSGEEGEIEEDESGAETRDEKANSMSAAE